MPTKNITFSLLKLCILIILSIKILKQVKKKNYNSISHLIHNELNDNYIGMKHIILILLFTYILLLNYSCKNFLLLDNISDSF